MSGGWQSERRNLPIKKGTWNQIRPLQTVQLATLGAVLLIFYFQLPSLPRWIFYDRISKNTNWVSEIIGHATIHKYSSTGSSWSTEPHEAALQQSSQDLEDTDKVFPIRIPAMGSPISDAKLVVLVITNDDPIYEVNRKVWSLVAQEDSGIRIYFVMGDPTLPPSSPFVVDDDTGMLYIRTEENTVPGILIKTVEALRWLLLSPRHNFKYILRTNMSSMWCWKRLMAHLENLDPPNLGPSGMVAGVITKLNNPSPDNSSNTFVSGAGMLMDRDAALAIVERSAELSYHLADDVAMSKIWNRCNTSVLPLSRCDFTNNALTLPLDLDHACYHWRVKNPKDRKFYDGYILSRLYAELYASDPLIPTQHC